MHIGLVILDIFFSNETRMFLTILFTFVVFSFGKHAFHILIGTRCVITVEGYSFLIILGLLPFLRVPEVFFTSLPLTR